MSQKMPSDGGQKGFAVGRGLLAAAETLNYSMGEQHSDGLHGPSSRQLNSMVSGMGGGDGQDRNSQLPRRGGGGPGSHIGNSMKLFASLGLSPTDLNELAQIPEENISVETLPHLIMQLKNRKGDQERGRMAGNPRDLLSSESSYRTTREEWEDSMRGGRLGTSMGQSSARGPQGDFGYGGSMQDAPGGARGYELDYGGNSGGIGGGGVGGGVRERQYSELSRDHYGGMGMAPPASDSVFMQRRMDSPSHGQVQDFLGIMPHTFPHLCSLCDFDVHSAMGWNQHSNGLRHAESRRLLLQIYPDWDPGTAPSRSSRSLMLETTNPSMGLLGDAPMSMGQQGGGMTSSWGGGTGSGQGKVQSHSVQPKIRSRVVVAKYDRKPLSNKSLFALAQPFGTISEHLVLKSKAFLEMQTHKEALSMVNYYQQKPAVLYGKEITFYLSKELITIEKDDRMDGVPRERKGRPSQVVFFSNLPRETEKKMELLTIAKRFGTVEKHLFLNDEAFVQLGTPEDAEMLVKYYTLNPLTIKGRRLRLNICAKYKTLNVSRSRQAQGQGWSAADRTRKNSTSSTGTRAPSSSTKSPKSTSTTKGKEDKEEDPKLAEGSGDEVAGVMEGDEDDEDDGGDEAAGDDQADAEGADAEQANSEAGPQDGEPEPEGVREEKTESDGGGAEKASGPGAEQGTGPKEHDDGQAEMSAPGETEAFSEEPEAKDDTSATEPAETSDMADEALLEDQEGSMEQDFPENMDDFVTLDELAEEEDMDSQSKDSSAGKSKKGREMRVVNVTGFKRGQNFRSELLALAKPFGKVEKHLVLDLRPEAFLELSSEEEAKAMVQFYNGNVTPMVCGKPVRMYHSQTYPTIECGNSKVVYVGGIPHTKYSDSQILRIAEPFGKIRRFFLNRNRSECFIEMEHGEDAEKMAEAFRVSPPKFQNKRLTVYVSRKYKQLKYGPPGAPLEKEEKRPSKRERPEGEVATGTSPAKPPTEQQQEKEEQEPPAKKPKEEKSPAAEEIKKEEEPQEKEKESVEAAGAEQLSVTLKEEPKENADQPSESGEAQKMDTDAVIKRGEETEVAGSTNVDVKNGEDQQTADLQTPAAEAKPALATLPLAPYDPSNPIGVEYVKMGYYCRVCFLFYSNEESAKKVHCSSQAHYDKLKKYLEKEKAKGKRVSL